MTMQIEVSLPGKLASSYPIRIGSGLLEHISLWMPKSIGIVVIITDHYVKTHYASLLIQSLKKEGYKTLLLSFLAGEQSKNSRTKSKLEEQMLEHGCGRDSLILALGGGVVYCRNVYARHSLHTNSHDFIGDVGQCCGWKNRHRYPSR